VTRPGPRRAGPRRVIIGVVLGAAVSGALGLGCAAHEPLGPPLGAIEWQAIVGLEETLRRLEEDMPRAMSGDGRPDCDRACFLAYQVCLLSARICSIADSYPGDAAARARCRDAAGRCERARARATERCRCF